MPNPSCGASTFCKSWCASCFPTCYRCRLQYTVLLTLFTCFHLPQHPEQQTAERQEWLQVCARLFVQRAEDRLRVHRIHNELWQLEGELVRPWVQVLLLLCWIAGIFGDDDDDLQVGFLLTLVSTPFF